MAAATLLGSTTPQASPPTRRMQTYAAASSDKAGATDLFSRVVGGQGIDFPTVVTGVVPQWPAARRWTPRYLSQTFGAARVVVKGAVAGRAPEMMSMPLSLFAEHSGEGSRTMWAYLLDETFIASHPALRDALPDPLPWSHLDLFKLLPRELQPWDNMLLWGSPFSRSALHVDPYNWTGTNSVFSGVKMWKFVPPQHQHLIARAVSTGSSGFPLETRKYHCAIDLFDTADVAKYPGLAEVLVTHEQTAGELLLIPSGWWHQAFNPVETIAVSSQMLLPADIDSSLKEMVSGGGLANVRSRRVGESAVDYARDVFSSIPESVRKRGREVMEDVRRQIELTSSGPGAKKTKVGAPRRRSEL